MQDSPELNEHEAAARAAHAFLATMRRQWITEFPDRVCPVLDLSQMNIKGRSIMLNSMLAAIRAANAKS